MNRGTWRATVHGVTKSLKKKKINKPIKTKKKKWSEVLNRHFSKEDIDMGKKHIKRRSISLIIGKMQIKTTIRYHLTLLRMTII